MVNRQVPDLADEARCPDEPAIPAAFRNDKEEALWMSRALEAGEECRNAFKALRQWVMEPPT